jgi:hypothetical protein
MADLSLPIRLISAMRQKGYRVDNKPGEVNIVYVEGMNVDGTQNDDAPNEFNDTRAVIDFVTGEPRMLGIWEATTEPGRHWTLNPMSAKGAARVEFGQHRDVWQVGTHNNSHEALVQTGGPITVCRDLNKDYERDGDVKEKGYFGINQHWGYDKPKSDLGTSSAGCLVGRTTAGHRRFMEIVKTDPRYIIDRSFKFSATVLPALAVVAALPALLVKRGISEVAVNLIVSEEVTSRQVYDRKYRHPEWPGGGSGVTIGIGYDVGAGVNSIAQLRSDWSGVIPDKMIDALASAVGITGVRAQELAAQLHDEVDVPWDAAMTVFRKVTLPRYYAMCEQSLPNFERLSPDCRGALVSLVYNRGASFSKEGDRYREMRAIKHYMISREYAEIPGEIRSMKRLWIDDGLGGLLARRDREAKLFEQGLKGAVSQEVVAAGGTVVAGGAAAEALRQSGADFPVIAVVVAVSIAVAIVLWLLLRRRK